MIFLSFKCLLVNSFSSSESILDYNKKIRNAELKYVTFSTVAITHHLKSVLFGPSPFHGPVASSFIYNTTLTKAAEYTAKFATSAAEALHYRSIGTKRGLAYTILEIRISPIRHCFHIPMRYHNFLICLRFACQINAFVLHFIRWITADSVRVIDCQNCNQNRNDKGIQIRRNCEKYKIVHRKWNSRITIRNLTHFVLFTLRFTVLRSFNK